MTILALIALVAAFLFLVLAGVLPPPWWIAALDGLAFSLAASALFALASAARRLPIGQKSKKVALPVAAATLALSLRGTLVAWLSPQEAIPRIDFVRLQLAALSIVAAAFALLSAVALLGRSGHPATLAISGAAIAAALFVAGPVLLKVGVPLDHRTFLGLAGLGLGAFAVVEAGRRLGAKKG